MDLMPKAVVIRKFGGPEVLEIVNQKVFEPGPGEVLLRHTVIGLNRYDAENRSGVRKLKTLPAVIGMEAVGVVEKSGDGVIDFNVGDRVAYCTAPCGSYCEKRVIDQKYLINIPKDVPDEIVAAVLLKGMTAHYLTHRVYSVQKGTFALVHGASGGVGHIICQWANSRKCTVIGTVSSDIKREIALQNGCSYAINYNDPNFVKQIMEITKDKGVNVVYDPIGLKTSRISFESLGLFGLYASYGQISGAVPDLNLSLLSSRSLFIASTSITHYKRHKFDLMLTGMEIFQVIRKGYVKVNINKRYRFDDIMQAHKDMEAGLLTGSNIILVK